jgi:hypothetical protein
LQNFPDIPACRFHYVGAVLLKQAHGFLSVVLAEMTQAERQCDFERRKNILGLGPFSTSSLITVASLFAIFSLLRSPNSLVINFSPRLFAKLNLHSGRRGRCCNSRWSVRRARHPIQAAMV